jgi:uncharacterized protein YcnI
MRRTIPVAIAAMVLAPPCAASAHVTLQPDTAPAGGFTRLDVRVPNERDDKGTIKVDLKLPPGFVSASYEPVPGWTVKVAKEKLAEPIKVEGLDVNEQISRITWTGDPKQGGIIAPGQFQDFGLSLAIPKAKPGATLTFKALQTYQGGEIVRWIGPADSDEPAPTVTLTGADGTEDTGAASGTPGANATPTPAPAQSAAADDGGSDGLAIAALVVAALGLAAGIAGLVVARRARAAASTATRDHAAA